MATKAAENWLKLLLFVFGMLFVAFTLYVYFCLQETYSEDDRERSVLKKLIRNKRAAEDDCLWVKLATEIVKTLTSPNYPENYPSNANCRWLLTTRDPNSTISIKIDTLVIEPEKDCRLDYLQVYLGSHFLAPALDPFCGNINNKVIETNSSTLLLVFHSDMAYEDKGFSIDYYIKTEEDCKELLTDGSNSLTSPKFPKKYPLDTDCWTLITVDEGKKIILIFDSVDLEYGQNCSFDYVQIFDGNSKNSTLLGQICQETDVRNFESSSNSLLVHFHSDDSVTGKGYRARYSSVDERSTPIGNCLWVSGENNGTITSPNFPENYPSFANCSIWILAPEGHQILIKFDILLMEIESNCSYDFLEIKEGILSDSKTLGKFCGRKSEPEHLISNEHEVQIQFQSDAFIEFLGFKLRYEFFKKEAETKDDTTDDDQDSLEAFNFSVKPQNATLSLGSSYMLHCNTDHPNSKIRWLKGDLFLAGDNPLPGLKVLTNNSLWIQSMSDQLIGTYTCVAVSPEGDLVTTANILLKGKPNELSCELEFRKTPKDSEFEEGDFAHLECQASPGIRMSWEKDGQLLLQQNHIEVLKNGYILMDKVKLSDAGVYTCVAENTTTGCIKRVSAKLTVYERVKVEEICGKPRIEESPKNELQENHAKIVGGHDAQKGAYPWQVMLWERKHKSFCGGILLNERWIATAAHCIENKYNIPWDRIKIKLGKHDREQQLEEQEMETSIADSSAIFVHPGYKSFTYDNDLALIRMRSRVHFTDYILPVCIGDRNLTEFLLNGDGDDSEPRMGTVTGWGLLKEKGLSPRFLQEIKLPVVDHEVCQASTKRHVTRNMFCAGYSQEVIGDSCEGDSGGPFLMKHEGRWYVVGLVSWGEGCGRRNKYGFYTRIGNHLPWIYGIIKS